MFRNSDLASSSSLSRFRFSKLTYAAMAKPGCMGLNKLDLASLHVGDDAVGSITHGMLERRPTSAVLRREMKRVLVEVQATNHGLLARKYLTLIGRLKKRDDLNSDATKEALKNEFDIFASTEVMLSVCMAFHYNIGSLNRELLLIFEGCRNWVYKLKRAILTKMCRNIHSHVLVNLHAY